MVATITLGLGGLLLGACAGTQARLMGVDLSVVESVEMDIAAVETAYLEFRAQGGDLPADTARRLQLALSTAHTSTLRARQVALDGESQDRVLAALQGARVALLTISEIRGGTW